MGTPLGAVGSSVDRWINEGEHRLKSILHSHLPCLAIGLLAFAAYSQAQTVSAPALFSANGFEPPLASYSSDRPVSIAMGDFNRDGKLDIAVANYYGSYEGGRVSIMFGNGDGTFKAPVSYYSGGLSVSVATADFNKDGVLDLVVANQNSADVSVFLGKGDGTFNQAVTYPAGFYPNAVVVGDFNGDGYPDLAVADESNRINILMGKGNGFFDAAVSIPGGDNPTSIVVGDFNGDGKLDLAVTNHGYSGALGSTIGVLLGNGDGTFKAGISYAAGSSPRFLAVSDFNGDGKLDLVVASDVAYPSGGGAVLLGNGDGTFQAPLPYLAASFPFALAVADFNGDGKPDLAVANSGTGGCGNSVSVLLGKGDGTFMPAVNFGAGTGPSAIAAADLNGDHLLDLVVADVNSNSISALMATPPSELANSLAVAQPVISGCWDRITQPGGILR